MVITFWFLEYCCVKYTHTYSSVIKSYDSDLLFCLNVTISLYFWFNNFSDLVFDLLYMLIDNIFHKLAKPVKQKAKLNKKPVSNRPSRVKVRELNKCLSCYSQQFKKIWYTVLHMGFHEILLFKIWFKFFEIIIAPERLKLLYRQNLKQNESCCELKVPSKIHISLILFVSFRVSSRKSQINSWLVLKEIPLIRVFIQDFQ